MAFILVLASALAVSPANALAAQFRIVHVVVALCDNVHQGIVPVPAKLGNGDDPANNLYWGAAYGVKTFMRKQPGWTMHAAPSPSGKPVLERLVFSNKGAACIVVADAYRGKAIREATIDFLGYTAGRNTVQLTVAGQHIVAGGGADLVIYVGHNGLMDFSLPSYPQGDGTARQAAVFACQSERYFGEAFRAAGAYPLLWTRGNMAPEAYTVHALIMAWAAGKTSAAIHESAAGAYDKYQKCGLKGARNLFATGWR